MQKGVIQRMTPRCGFLKGNKQIIEIIAIPLFLWLVDIDAYCLQDIGDVVEA